MSDSDSPDEANRDFPPIPLTVEQIATLFDVTTKTVRSWIRGGLPTLKAGGKGKGNGAKVDLFELMPWYLEENALDVAKTRLASAQAEKHEMDNAVRRGELAEIKAVEGIWTDLVLSARAKLLSMPAKLGPRLINVADPAVLSKAIGDEVAAALSELARGSGSAGAAEPAGDEVEPAAAADGERVGRRKPKAEPRKQRGARNLAN